MDDFTKQRFQALEAAATEGAAQGLKSLFLLNGGACVALLTFVGSASTSQNLKPEFVPLVESATKSLICFAVGAGLTVLAMTCAYLTNQAYSSALIDPSKTDWSEGTRANLGTVVIALAALVSFFVGITMIALSLP
ncbi:hypothetical protein FY145_07055 [Agrobacterium tumefaciens]|uniref:Uncharacterized protein n=1 Tax=Agrobacterium tumefaciens TaxID=358 RepID=A0AAP9E318_AGRTU|nr:hypothetical protein [Agrobacterium tumefaciens]NSZ57788.1 hypothetical protein [Agrobacterium tumefaciens]QDY93906.1 hypothetical protein CG010_007050 [Agrobacterium tumefaciens]UXS48979.1 hypothetical protein FY149_17175 [Agrobacterium tumefaciens]UXS70283.1 hypothetical protein FY146_07055 [Agrobacterium tumefaciens]UXS77945.1 hypothetical protein FY145_07055 [Agrobacterium tumefaciens]